MKTLLYSLLILTIVFSCLNSAKQTDKVSSTIKILKTDSEKDIIAKAAHVVPTDNQYDALKDEFIAFIHFGPNTFTKNEWGNGMEDPKVFNLKTLDTDQWCKAMKSAGMTKVIFTVKHHDGFCLWQTRYTNHGIMATGFENGKGDVLRNLSKSCEKYNLKLGIYLSPADLFQIESKDGLYGNLSKITKRKIPKDVDNRPFKNKATFTFEVDDYNEYCLNQLFELLTEYGKIYEVWFDGANPKQKGNQQYDYLAWRKLIATLAPEAVVFGKQDVRWCGNESGRTRKTEWNIIPYQEDPAKMSVFPDMTGNDIASNEKLYTAKYLHYQYAEINTSIRGGWFFRDTVEQQVRSVDDVFDMYERSVGGNAVFLLNIPPNREGEFSAEDVKVLKEVGKRIKKTYSKNLFVDAEGPKNVLDNDELTYEVLDKKNNSIIITTPQNVTINRLVIQEAIVTHSERVESFILEVWKNNSWKLIVSSTNIGYKRILRFQDITSNKFRIKVLNFRLEPAISNITAHYYNTQPPQLTLQRDVDGMVTIQPKKSNFSWKPHGEDIAKNLHNNIEIRYTVDGTLPNKKSVLYNQPFKCISGEIEAVAIDKGVFGSVVSNVFGVVKNRWKLIGASSSVRNHEGVMAFDGNPKTYWNSKSGNTHFIAIDLGQKYLLTGFTYTPQIKNSKGMIEKGVVRISEDGKKWTLYEEFTFGNLINDPTTRKYTFKNAHKIRYIKIESKVIAGGDNTASIAEVDFLLQ